MELRKDGHYQGHSHRANHPTNRIALDADEIGPLTEEQCDLLDALERASDCYQIYKSKKLPWGLELEKGDMVLARLPTSATFNGVQYATSIIRWAGMTDCGHRFGVEIMDTEHHGHGMTDGKFHSKKYFSCREDRGLFLTLYEMKKPPRSTAALRNNFSELEAEVADLEEKLSAEQDRSQQLEEEQDQYQQLLRDEQDRSQQLECDLRDEHECDLRDEQDRYQQLECDLRDEQDRYQQLECDLRDEHECDLRDEQDRYQQLECDLRNEQDRSQQLECDLRDEQDRSQQLEYELREERDQSQQLEYQEQDRSQQLEARMWLHREQVQISPAAPLGTGAWGYVAKGTFHGKQVAVKCLHRSLFFPHNMERVRREIRILQLLRHPNLLLMIGAVDLTEREGPIIVTELLDTSLRSAYQEGLLAAISKFPVLQDVACALTYLHSLDPPILHRDVSSANVLLEAIRHEKQWKAKLADFGSANFCSLAITPAEGAPLYSAPEVCTEQSRRQTAKIDVYSFGVLVCEVCLCQFPPERLDLVSWQKQLRYTAQRMYRLSRDCTKHNPIDRPKMKDVQQRIDSIIANV